MGNLHIGSILIPVLVDYFSQWHPGHFHKNPAG